MQLRSLALVSSGAELEILPKSIARGSEGWRSGEQGRSSGCHLRYPGGFGTPGGVFPCLDDLGMAGHV